MNKTLVFPRWVSGLFLALFMGVFSGCGGGSDAGDINKAADPATSATQNPNSGAEAPATNGAGTTPSTGNSTGTVAASANEAGTGQVTTDAAGTTASGSGSGTGDSPGSVSGTTVSSVNDIGTNSSTGNSTVTSTASTNVAGTSSGVTNSATTTTITTTTTTTTTDSTGTTISSTNGTGTTASTGNSSGTDAVAINGAGTTTSTTGNTGTITSLTNGAGATTSTGNSTGTATASTNVAGTSPAATNTTGTTVPGSGSVTGVSPGSVSDTTVSPVNGIGTTPSIGNSTGTPTASTSVAGTSPAATSTPGTTASGSGSGTGVSVGVVSGSGSSTASVSILAVSSSAPAISTPSIQMPARLKVSNSSPSTGAADVFVNSAIVLNFSEEMNPADINSTTFTVHDGVSNVPGIVTYTGRTATFTPSENLGANTINTVTLQGSVRNLSGVPISAPFTYIFKTGANLDTVSPIITSTSPMSNATGVFVNRFIALNFNEAINVSDITPSTLTVTKDIDGSNVTGVVSYSGVTAAFTPASALEFDTSYTVSLDGSVRDLAGNQLGNVFQYSFTTGNGRDTVRPTVKSESPVANTMFVFVDSEITLTFSEVMIASGITTETFKVRDDSDGTFISGAVTYARLKGTFTPDVDLKADTNYTVILSCGTMDLAENMFGVRNANGDIVDCSQFTYTFKTEPDEDAPTIVSSIPSGFAAGIFVNRPVILNFSEPMNQADMNVANIVVELNSGGGEVSGSVTSSDTRATFTPDADLEYDTEYVVIVSGNIRDLAGNPIGVSNNRIIFTTASPGYVSFLSKLPDTGQTTSYSDTFGDDSDYTISPPSYTDNGNGTVTDNVTSLMWQQRDDAVKRNWSDAVSYCKGLSLGGHSDWRLPTLFEIESITDSSVYNPSINSSYFLNTSVYRYWAYTTTAWHPSMAWNVYFSNGIVEFAFKANDYYVRCVR